MQCTEKLYKLQQRVGKYESEKLKLTTLDFSLHIQKLKMDSQNMSYNAGQAKGQAQVYL